MKIFPFQAIYPNLDFISSTDSFCDSVKENYLEYKQSGFFHRASRDALYICQIESKDRTYTGLIGCIDTEAYHEGRIIPHEGILPHKEQKQIQLILRRNAAVKPVLLTHPPVEALRERITAYLEGRRPLFSISFDEADFQSRFWQITEGEAIREIQLLFEKHIAEVYIADGHHRTAANALLHRRSKGKGRPVYGQLLSAFFDTRELEILDFNRVVHGLGDHSPTRFMAGIARIFEIEPLTSPVKPSHKHELIMWINREWYRLTLRQKIREAYEGEKIVLDAMILNELVMTKLLGIEDVRTDARVQFVEGPAGLEAIAKTAQQAEKSVGFCLYPVKIGEMMKLADEGKVLPPKSTWFEPRLQTGLIVYEF
ncbi:MAG: DUF1015 family protein [Saprospiraceae bacterium]|nr:DUF1015 family protein [Saprospiraceae bacterium]